MKTIPLIYLSIILLFSCNPPKGDTSNADKNSKTDSLPKAKALKDTVDLKKSTEKKKKVLAFPTGYYAKKSTLKEVYNDRSLLDQIHTAPLHYIGDELGFREMEYFYVNLEPYEKTANVFCLKQSKTSFFPKAIEGKKAIEFKDNQLLFYSDILNQIGLLGNSKQEFVAFEFVSSQKPILGSFFAGIYELNDQQIEFDQQCQIKGWDQYHSYSINTAANTPMIILHGDSGDDYYGLDFDSETLFLYMAAEGWPGLAEEVMEGELIYTLKRKK